MLVSPPCERGGSRVVVLLRCFPRDGRSGRYSSAGCRGAVALEGRGVCLGQRRCIVTQRRDAVVRAGPRNDKGGGFAMVIIIF